MLSATVVLHIFHMVYNLQHSIQKISHWHWRNHVINDYITKKNRAPPNRVQYPAIASKLRCKTRILDTYLVHVHPLYITTKLYVVKYTRCVFWFIFHWVVSMVLSNSCDLFTHTFYFCLIGTGAITPARSIISMKSANLWGDLVI